MKLRRRSSRRRACVAGRPRSGNATRFLTIRSESAPAPAAPPPLTRAPPAPPPIPARPLRRAERHWPPLLSRRPAPCRRFGVKPLPADENSGCLLAVPHLQIGGGHCSTRATCDLGHLTATRHGCYPCRQRHIHRVLRSAELHAPPSSAEYCSGALRDKALRPLRPFGRPERPGPAVWGPERCWVPGDATTDIRCRRKTF